MNTRGDNTDLSSFLYEVGQLKRTSRTDWSLARLVTSETVADHSFRAAVIALTLASMAGVNPERTCAIALLHDLPEDRLGDMNHVAKAYVAEEKPFANVIADQTRLLPKQVADKVTELAQEFLSGDSLEGMLARDADTVEAILHVQEWLPDRPELRNRWTAYLKRKLKTTRRPTPGQARFRNTLS